MRAFKPGRRFESPHELVGSLAGLGVLATLAVVSLALAVPAILGSVQAWREVQAVYEPKGSLVSVQHKPLSPEMLKDIASRATAPGVEFSVSEGRRDVPLGIEVRSAKIESMRDFSTFRSAIDRVMLSAPDAQWDIVTLCAGAGCYKNSAGYALLIAKVPDVKMNASLTEMPQPSFGAALLGGAFK